MATLPVKVKNRTSSIYYTYYSVNHIRVYSKLKDEVLDHILW